MSLLPSNSTPLERALERTISEELSEVREALPWISKIYDPKAWEEADYPEIFLTLIAWSLRIEIWDARWSAKIKRDMIKAYARIRSLRGTRESVLLAYEIIGIGRDAITLNEWWEAELPRYHFQIDLKGSATPLQTKLLRRVTTALKPLRSRFLFSFTNDASLRGRVALVGRGVKVLRFDLEVS